MATHKGQGPEDLSGRTRRFAIRIIRLFVALPKTTVAQVLGRQLLRSGTSVGAHYREATRSRSTAEFVSKLQGGLQELAETTYWMELVVESGTMPSQRMGELMAEANELTAILITCVNNAKRRRTQETS